MARTCTTKDIRRGKFSLSPADTDTASAIRTDILAAIAREDGKSDV